MRNQEEILSDPSADQGIAKRLARAIYMTGLTQTEFSKRLGISPAFLSDAVRGLKKPGAEILSLIHDTFGISIDWLLTGDGNLFGYKIIDIDLLRDIQVQVGVVNAALIEGNETALNLLRLLEEGNRDEIATSPEIVGFLDSLSLGDLEHNLAVELYNEFVQLENPVEGRKNLINAVIQKVKVHKPKDKFSQLLQSTSSGVKIKIIGTQFNIKGNYYKS